MCEINIKKDCAKAITEFFLPEDRNILNEMRSFFIKKRRGVFNSIYRVRKINGEFGWVFTNAKVFRSQKNADNLEIIGVSIDFSIDINYDKNIKNLLKEKIKKVNNPHLKKVSKRELEIVKYFANGYKSKEIALQLDISFHTVNNHRKNILRKLKLRNLASLVNFAVDNGLD